MELEPQIQPPARPGWARRHVAGVVCCCLGLAAVAVTALVHFGGQGSISKLPDVRLTVPFLVVTLAAGVAALARREGAYALPLAGMGLAAAAVVLGWALVLAVIAGLTLLAILILSEMM